MAMTDGDGRPAASEFRTGWPALAGAALGLATGVLTIFYFTQGCSWARSARRSAGRGGGCRSST